MDAPPPARTLDLSGLKCPLPALRTQKALRGLAAGTRLTVISTDPLASLDIPHLLGQTGHALLDTRREADRTTFLIEVRDAPAASAAADG